MRENMKAREVETLRSGTQSRLQEPVKVAKEDKNCQKKALGQREDATEQHIAGKDKPRVDNKNAKPWKERQNSSSDYETGAKLRK